MAVGLGRPDPGCGCWLAVHGGGSHFTASWGHLGPSLTRGCPSRPHHQSHLPTLRTSPHAIDAIRAPWGMAHFPPHEEALSRSPWLCWLDLIVFCFGEFLDVRVVRSSTLLSLTGRRGPGRILPALPLGQKSIVLVCRILCDQRVNNPCTVNFPVPCSCSAASMLHLRCYPSKN